MCVDGHYSSRGNPCLQRVQVGGPRDGPLERVRRGALDLVRSVDAIEGSADGGRADASEAHRLSPASSSSVPTIRFLASRTLNALPASGRAPASSTSAAAMKLCSVA